MLASKAVVTCTDSGGTLEFVQDRETGLVVEPEADALAAAMDELWNDRRLAGSLGAQAIDNALVKCAQITRDAVACDQRQGARACRRTDFERVAEVVGDFEDLYSDILADAGLIREDA